MSLLGNHYGSTAPRLNDGSAAPSPRAEGRRDTAEVLGCLIDRLDMTATLERCAALIDSGEPTQHVAINAAKLVAMQRDPRLREIIAGCGLVNADGQSVVWVSRLLGDPLPERVAGIDLMQALLRLAEERGYGVFVLGAREHVLQAALARLRVDYPRAQIVGSHHGYFSDAENAAVCKQISESGADILFVAMSSPRKEYWLAESGGALGVPFLMGVGGSIDVLAGLTRRAPRWMQRVGLEWAYRLAQEPARLTRRYASTNTRFVILVGREWLGRRRARAPRASS